MKKTKRIEWIDISKGLGMILVVLGHTGIAQFSQVTYDLIYSFHMPLFYFLSGLCFNSNKYNKFIIYIKRRWKTLIVPFLILNSILFILGGILFNIPNLKINNLELITGVSTLYFIRVLFISELWCFIIRKLISDRILFILVIVGISLTGEELADSKLVDWFKYIIPCQATIFYALGNILSNHLKSYNKIKPLYSTIIAILSLVFLLSHLYKYTDLTSLILAIFGITMIIGISFVPCPIKILKDIIVYIGQNTLVILAFHPILYNGMKPITSLFIQSNTIDGVFRMIATLIILFILIYVFNKWLPWAVGKTNK